MAAQNYGLVIFAARESADVLRQTLDTAISAAHDFTTVDVLVNGNPQLAHDVVAGLGLYTGCLLRVWSIPLGDKANAWNQYIHHIWDGQSLAFFIDGYVRINHDAVTLLGSAVTSDSTALGGSGVPSCGRSAPAVRKTMLENGGMHGNFCCIKGSTIAEMRQRQIRLPLGLYRTDSLMGAIISYALHPGIHQWDRHRILVHPEVSWQTDDKHWWDTKEAVSYLKRHLRQARGELENKAVADHLAIRRQAPELLPVTARKLVLEWAHRCPNKVAEHFGVRPLVRWALHKFRTLPELSQAGIAPELIWSSTQV